MDKTNLSKIEKENVDVQSTSANNVSVEEADYEEIVCPTRVAMIQGEERTIIVAHTDFSMELPKDKKELCKNLDPSKMLSCIFHFTPPHVFWNEGYDLYDENGDVIEKGTSDVFVHVQTAEDYWRIGIEEKLERVELLEFPSVKEYAQTIGCTNLYSRGMTDAEKVGIAALATGNKAYKAVFEFAKEHKLSLTTAKLYLDLSMSKTQILEMSTGIVPEKAPKLGRTKNQAADLLKQAENKFGKIAYKRYVIRPLNSLEHQKKYSREMIIAALKLMTESQVESVEICNTDERESLISSILTGIIKTSLQSEAQTEVA